MSFQTPSGQAMIGELLGLLDEEIVLLDLRRRQLEALSEAIVVRDNDRLEGLLEEIERTLEVQTSTDGKLKALRAALAEKMAGPGGVPLRGEEVRLSALAQRLEGEQPQALEDRRRQIVQLAGELRTQHLRTAILLTECGRINRMLLEAIFPRSQSVTTYSEGGSSSWRPDTGLVDAER